MRATARVDDQIEDLLRPGARQGDTVVWNNAATLDGKVQLTMPNEQRQKQLTDDAARLGLKLEKSVLR